MKLLFFDMEFANGQVAGSIYSVGYMVTNEKFKVLTPPTDLLINPECRWNAYVRDKILAYPMKQVEAAPNFAAHYKKLKKLFKKADIAIGFAVKNDTRALSADCCRYALEPISYRAFDTELLCRLIDENQDARGLAKCVRAWCGEDPANQHRSDGDALATMRLFQAICQAKHVSAEMMIEAYPECCFDVRNPQKNQEKTNKKKKCGSIFSLWKKKKEKKKIRGANRIG